MKQTTTTTKDLIYLDNKLAQASYNLSLSEQRLLFLALSKLNQGYLRNPTQLEQAKHMLGAIELEDLDLRVEGDKFDSTTEFTVKVVDYARVYGIRSVDARKELQDACNAIFTRQVTVKEESGKYTKFHWVQGVSFNPETDSISFYWSIYILPYIKDLQNYFTKLPFGKLVELNSIYSWKLFTILSSKKGENKYKGFQKISVEDLMFMLDVPTSCKEFKHFNNLILKKVAKEFQSKLGLEKFTIEFEKEGRFVKQVVFKGFSFAKDS